MCNKKVLMNTYIHKQRTTQYNVIPSPHYMTQPIMRNHYRVADYSRPAANPSYEYDGRLLGTEPLKTHLMSRWHHKTVG